MSGKKLQQNSLTTFFALDNLSQPPENRHMLTPFMKYPGGKRRIAHHIVSRLLAHEPEHYVEPFVGGGAVFLALRNAGFTGPAMLNDANPHVAKTWRAVRDRPGDVILRFNEHVAQHEGTYYYGVRRRPHADDDVTVAAWFLYVSRAGFNGLVRYNSKGEFNVPLGDYKEAPKLDEELVMRVQEALVNVDIQCLDFSSLTIPRGSAVYCDPPYLPKSATASFTAYTRSGFTPSDQVRLAQWAKALSRVKDCLVVVSNSGTDDSLTAFRQGADDAFSLTASRVISCKGKTRDPVDEWLFSYQPTHSVEGNRES